MIKKIDNYGDHLSSEERKRWVEIKKKWASDNGFDPMLAMGDSMFVDLGARKIHFNQIITTSPEGEQFPEGIQLRSVAKEDWRSPGVDSEGIELSVPRIIDLLVAPPVEIIEGGE